MVDLQKDLLLCLICDNYKNSWQPSTYYCRFNVKSTCTQYAVVNCAEYSMPPLCLPFLVTMEIPITYTNAMYTMGTLTLSLIRLLTLNSRELNQGPQLVLLQSHWHKPHHNISKVKIVATTTVKMCWNIKMVIMCVCQWCFCKPAYLKSSPEWKLAMTRLHPCSFSSVYCVNGLHKCMTSLWKFEELCSRLTYHPCGLVTLSVTIQSPWLPACPRPDGGREYLITVATCLRFGSFPPPKTKYPPIPNGKIITKLIAIVSFHIH